MPNPSNGLSHKAVSKADLKAADFGAVKQQLGLLLREAEAAARNGYLGTATQLHRKRIALARKESGSLPTVERQYGEFLLRNRSTRHAITHLENALRVASDPSSGSDITERARCLTLLGDIGLLSLPGSKVTLATIRENLNNAVREISDIFGHTHLLWPQVLLARARFHHEASDSSSERVLFYFGEAAKVALSVYGEKSRKLVPSLLALGNSLLEQDEPDNKRALGCFKLAKTLSRRKSLPGKTSPNLEAYTGMSIAHFRLEEFQLAREAWSKGFGLRKRVPLTVEDQFEGCIGFLGAAFLEFAAAGRDSATYLANSVMVGKTRRNVDMAISELVKKFSSNPNLLARFLGKTCMALEDYPSHAARFALARADLLIEKDKVRLACRLLDRQLAKLLRAKPELPDESPEVLPFLRLLAENGPSAKHGLAIPTGRSYLQRATDAFKNLIEAHPRTYIEIASKFAIACLDTDQDRRPAIALLNNIIDICVSRSRLPLEIRITCLLNSAEAFASKSFPTQAGRALAAAEKLINASARPLRSDVLIRHLEVKETVSEAAEPEEKDSDATTEVTPSSGLSVGAKIEIRKSILDIARQHCGLYDLAVYLENYAEAAAEGEDFESAQAALYEAEVIYRSHYHDRTGLLSVLSKRAQCLVELERETEARQLVTEGLTFYPPNLIPSTTTEIDSVVELVKALVKLNETAPAPDLIRTALSGISLLEGLDEVASAYDQLATVLNKASPGQNFFDPSVFLNIVLGVIGHILDEGGIESEAVQSMLGSCVDYADSVNLQSQAAIFREHYRQASDD